MEERWRILKSIDKLYLILDINHIDFNKTPIDSRKLGLTCPRCFNDHSDNYFLRNCGKQMQINLKLHAKHYTCNFTINFLIPHGDYFSIYAFSLASEWVKATHAYFANLHICQEKNIVNKISLLNKITQTSKKQKVKKGASVTLTTSTKKNITNRNCIFWMIHMVPANWFFKLSNRLPSQWTFKIQNISLGTGHYNILLLFTRHWLPPMMHILKTEINIKHIDCYMNSITIVLQKELRKMSVVTHYSVGRYYCICFINSFYSSTGSWRQNITKWHNSTNLSPSL